MANYNYFDGREWAGDHFYDWERDSVDVDYEESEFSGHGVGRIKKRHGVCVTPPRRLVYPRPVETIGEARALYLTEEITLEDFENYLDAILGREIDGSGSAAAEGMLIE